MEARINAIIGFSSDPALAGRLHDIGHAGRVEQLVLDADDVHRRRLRARTDKGTDCLIALPLDQSLGDGAVLVLEEDRAIVVRLAEQRWLKLAPRDEAAALELGYFAGNLHWRVKFQDARLLVALEGPKQDYLARLGPFLDDGRAVEVGDD
jgi:urease accessory protein